MLIMIMFGKGLNSFNVRVSMVFPLIAIYKYSLRAINPRHPNYFTQKGLNIKFILGLLNQTPTKTTTFKYFNVLK